MASSGVRATFIELYNRLVKIDKSKDGEVYWNGENNLYPNEIELVINNSPTASRASSLAAKYIAGKGLADESLDVIVNQRKNYRLSNVASIAAKSMSKQGGVYFHIGYKFNDELNIVQGSLDVLDYSRCRIDKEDDENNFGKIRYKDYALKRSANAKERWYYPYNPDQNVLRAQIKADYAEAKKIKTVPDDADFAEMIQHFRGQVFYLNLTPEYKYALSPFDSVYNHCDTEYRISLYINGEWRNGMLGKVAILTQGLDEDVADKIKSDIANWLGSENAAGVYHLDVAQAEDLDKVLKIIQVAAKYDEKIFEKTNAHLRDCILGAAHNIPIPLILSGDGAMFGTASDTYQQMKLFYSEQTAEWRWVLSETLTYLGFACELAPVVKAEVTEQDAETKRQEAQAQLRGSVGGVTALIALQQSVSQGYTQIPAAIEIIKNIYGIDEETATKMIGKPVKTEPATETTPTE